MVWLVLSALRGLAYRGKTAALSDLSSWAGRPGPRCRLPPGRRGFLAEAEGFPVGLDDDVVALVEPTAQGLRGQGVRTTLAVPEISFLPGFEEPNPFCRAFDDWTGQVPEAVRQTSVR